MATTRHPTTSPPTPGRPLRPAAPEPGTPDAATADAASTTLLTLGLFGWPFVVIVASAVLVVPFLAGLVLVGLAGAVLLVPYRLLRHWRRRR